MDFTDAAMNGSRLKLPTAVRPYAASSGLTEMSASENNIRSTVAQPTTLPNTAIALKHKPSGLHEPQSKMPRMHLAEQAGQPNRKHAAPPSIRHVNEQAKKVSQAGPKNMGSSFSSTMPTARGIPNPGFGKSVNGAVAGRPGMSRTQSALGYRGQASNVSRPASAFSHNRTKSQSAQGQQLAQTVASNNNAMTDDTYTDKFGFMDEFFRKFNSQMEGTTFEHKSLRDIIEMQRTQLTDLQLRLTNLTKESENMHEELEDEREQLSAILTLQQEQKREHEIVVDDLERKHRHDLEDLKDAHRKEMDKSRRDASSDEDTLRRQQREEIDRMVRSHRQELEDLERRYKKELEEEKDRRLREVNDVSTQRDEAISKIATGIGEKEREADSIRQDLAQRSLDLEREKQLRVTLETRLAEAAANNIALEASNSSMRANLDFLKSDNDKQSQQFSDLHKKTQEAIEAAAIANAKLRAEETLRRKLHNQVQELKGNIRVFCRVRPVLGEDEEAAKIGFPDEQDECREIAVRGPETKSALGNVTAANHAFNFDRVFGPSSANGDVFDEISQLVQSALDGYNVCIFCYGQTGSGKTFTMSSADGMIPRAVRQIYESATALEEKGWTYNMQGSFVEVYNENINDLLGRAEDLDKKKHEIHHDTKKCKTTITDIETVELDSPDRVQEVLSRADGNRSVAATKANMRSSRSHSVFILTLKGENSITGEKCEGTLNLVDLAGSERLSHSQAEGQRLKETQNINKSLSCLGDVIGALGSKGEGGHVPYRNSKLTYLLQYSLGGNSKTLMFVMVSPLQAHLNETITSLKFATKVHNTHIGTAKRQSKT